LNYLGGLQDHSCFSYFRADIPKNIKAKRRIEYLVVNMEIISLSVARKHKENVKKFMKEII